MMRRQDWPERLFAHIEAARGVPFAFGAHDCCLWAADAVLAMTDADPIEDIRGQWADEVSALRLLKERGGVEAMVTEYLGDPIAPAFAQRGDVVLHTMSGRDSLGVCVGDRFAAVADVGIEYVPMSAALKAWRV